jgi:branched-chain amino acid aminotransferase
MKVSINGKILDGKDAFIPVESEAFLFGFAVLETVRTFNHRIFRLHDHLARLYVSADIVGMKPKWSFKRTYKEVVRILEQNKHGEVKMRIILTTKELVITVEKIKEKPESYYKKGVKLVSYMGKRNNPRAKVLGDSFLYLAKHHALECGAYEALLIDPKKYYVRECAYANIFWVNDGKLYATNKDILYGITRDTVVELNGGECIFDGIKLNTFIDADEVFITQTTSGLLPVVEIDGHKIGNGKPGKLTRELMKKYKKLVWKK